MAGLNKVLLIGNLGADPESRPAGNGQVTTFRVAVTRKWAGSDGDSKERTDWFYIETWGRLAQTCAQSLKKGRLVYIEGRLQIDKVRKGDQDVYYTKIVAYDVQFLDRRGDH